MCKTFDTMTDVYATFVDTAAACNRADMPERASLVLLDMQAERILQHMKKCKQCRDTHGKRSI